MKFAPRPVDGACMILQTMRTRYSTAVRSLAGRRLEFASVCLLLLEAAVLALVLIGLYLLEAHFAHQVEYHLSVQYNVESLGIELSNAQVALERILAEPDDARVAERHSEYRAALRVIDESTQRLLASGAVTSDDPGIAAFTRAYHQWRQWLRDEGDLLSAAHAEGAGGDIAARARNDFHSAITNLNLAKQSIYEGLVVSESAALRRSIQLLSGVVAVLTLTGLLTGGLVTRQSLKAIRRREQALHEQNLRLTHDSTRRTFEGRLTTSLEMTESEPAICSLVGNVLGQTLPEQQHELLLADSSRAHLHCQATTRCGDGPMCAVGEPFHCPAVRCAKPLVYLSSNHFDACPYLKHRAGGACSGACVPVTVMGQAVGVIHSVGKDGCPPDSDQVETLTLVAARMGERLGLIRAFRQSESQAKTDPLTGLNNRRSLEAGLAAVARPDAVFAVVYADVDHFKRLNDTYGHDTGDRALRVFASVLRESVRDDDLLARWGGEEFVLVLKDFQAEQAVTVLERIRTHLAGRLVGGSLPAFTASFGVADNGDGGDFKEILDAADAALLAAKAAGRNCIVRAADARHAAEAGNAAEVGRRADAGRAADAVRVADAGRAADAKCVPAAAAGEDAVAAFLARA